MYLEARLRAFAAVSRRRSFSAAARELGISQPAVSKHVADIERRLGVRLIERRRQGAALTAAGVFLADSVLRAEALQAQAARGVTDFPRPPTGSLTIAASGVAATYLLPEVAIAFQRTYPGVRVRIVSAPSAQTMDALRAHRAEFGVLGGFAAAPEIEAEPLVEEDIVVVAPRSTPGVACLGEMRRPRPGSCNPRAPHSRRPRRPRGPTWESPPPGASSCQRWRP